MKSENGTNVLSTRRIVITGILSAIAILLAITRIGFIPIPISPTNATIMHVPAIIGGVIGGPIVGLLVGLIFGVFSMLQDTTGLFRNPLVSIVPRLFIGVAAYYGYALFRRRNEYLALVAAGVVGTLTNSVLVLGALVSFTPLEAKILPTFIPQVIGEIIIAVIITVAVVKALNRMEPRSGSKSSI